MRKLIILLLFPLACHSQIVSSISGVTAVNVSTIAGVEPCPNIDEVLTAGFECDTAAADSCNGVLLVDWEDHTYHTVAIGTQCWFQENLDIGNMIQISTAQTDNGVIEKYCYGNYATNCDTYGGLYQWDEAMQYDTASGSQGLCPTGWHIATDAEWCTLTQFIDPTVDCGDAVGYTGTDIAVKMKSTSGWSGGEGTNSSGFTALASGWGSYLNGIFLGMSINQPFWTSTQYYSGYYGRYRWLFYDYDQIIRNGDNHYKSDAFSIRCIKD